MSVPSYDDGEVVWVKWSSCWWPGEVWSRSRVPNDLTSSLRKPVIAFVKFFQEDSFECVKSPSNIMKYDCDKKLEHIKKGMDKYRTNIKVMENFPADVVKAEKLTKGNVNILINLDSPTKQKAAAVVTPSKPVTPVTTPIGSKKSSGAYNSSTKVQLAASPTPKSDKKFTCTLCDFATDRMNLLMFHIKNHSNHSSTFSPRMSDVSTVSKKSSALKAPVKRSLEATDSIADDVRKIKESLKKAAKPSPAPKQAREVVVKATPTGRSRSSKKAEQLEVEKVVEKPKPVNELKNELLADWMDDDDEMDKKPEELPVLPQPKPTPPPQEKVGESSKTIRNIPKKQRVSEIYLTTDSLKADEHYVEAAKSPAKESPKKVEEPQEDAMSPEAPKKSQKGNKKKLPINIIASEPESKKLPHDTDELLLATSELLNETEVPKVENAQVPSTFHKSNDIDKRNLPPKERNKRIFRANMSRESPPRANDHPATFDNGSAKAEGIVKLPPIQNELMLPHKKKQSSRLATTEKPSPVRETRNVRETRQESQTVDVRTRKKRKSSETTKSYENEILKTLETPEDVQSPLREAVDASTESSLVVLETNSNPAQRRGQKRRNSKDSQQASSLEEAHSEPKKLHQSVSETQPKTIVACASETICISSKGQLSVTCKDSIVATEANKVVVTSQVIITEAMQRPIMASPPLQSPKPQISATIKIPSHALKDAIKFPPEELMEMKKQGLVTVGSDMKQKFTEKGRQFYKQMMGKTAEVASNKKEENVPEPEQTQIPESPEAIAQKETSEGAEAVILDAIDRIEPETVETFSEREPVKESNGDSLHSEDTTTESTNNNDIEKETIVAEVTSPSKESQEESVTETLENGREAENESENPSEDNNGGLIALQAENFGGPPNCFYLCRQIDDDRYEPVNNQILVLNAQNALVPYEGDVAEDSLVPTAAAETSAGYPQLSPNSNIIINTPNGQKIELNHYAIQALQEQADENGMASIELSGEQLELNINGILEAISAQQEANEVEALIPGAVLIDSENALIIDASDIPVVEINHSATQVSETLSKPIMSATVAPEIATTKATIDDPVSKNLNIEDSLATIGVTTQPLKSNVQKSLELPITITNPTIAETVNNRKLANAAPLVVEILDVADTEVLVVQTPDVGSPL